MPKLYHKISNNSNNYTSLYLCNCLLSGKSVYRYRHIFAGEGTIGLLGEKKGPKSSWKITKDVKADILYLFFVKRLVGYEQIKKRLSRWGRQYPFFATLRKVIDIPGHEGYSLEELCGTLFYLDVFGFRSMEDFKRVYPEEFGPLIGEAQVLPILP